MGAKRPSFGVDGDCSQPSSAGIAPILLPVDAVGYMETDGTQTRLQQKRQRLTATLKASAGQLLQQFHTIRRALVHPEVPWYAKFGCGCAVLYVVSPIQLIPNFIPIIGQLDDVLVISLSIKLLKRSVPPRVLEECKNKPLSPIKSGAPVEHPTGADPERLP
jgi:uncharacterized membrane protein YkvA (DUF1232 family)